MSYEQYPDPVDPYADYQETPTSTAGDASGCSISPVGPAIEALWGMEAFYQYSQPQPQLLWSPAYQSDMTSNLSYSGSVPGQYIPLSPSDYVPMMSAPSPGLSYDHHPTQGLYSAPESARSLIPQRSLSVNEAAMVPTAPQTSMTGLPPTQAGLARPPSSRRPGQRSKKSSPASGVKATSQKPTQRKPARASTLPALTAQNLNLLLGAEAEEEQPTAQADVSASPQAEVHQWDDEARKRLMEAASNFIDSFKWISDGKKNHLKDLISTMPMSLAESKIEPGQVGSLFTTRHPNGPDGPYEWRLSDAPGSEFCHADDLTDTHKSLGGSKKARWRERAALHHGAIAIVTIALSSVPFRPSDHPLGDWIQSCLDQTEAGVRGVYQAAKGVLPRWPKRAVCVYLDGTQGPATLESRAWWFDGQHQDEGYGTQGHKSAWVVLDSWGIVDQSNPQAPVARSPVQD